MWFETDSSYSASPCLCQKVDVRPATERKADEQKYSMKKLQQVPAVRDGQRRTANDWKGSS